MSASSWARCEVVGEMEQNDIALKTTGLVLAYGNRIVLDDVNLEVRSGQFCFFLGPNGSGKKTLLRGILGGLQAGWPGTQGLLVALRRPTTTRPGGAGARATAPSPDSRRTDQWPRPLGGRHVPATARRPEPGGTRDPAVRDALSRHRGALCHAPCHLSLRKGRGRSASADADP